MAKAMMFVGGLACGFLLATGVLASHADDVSAEVSQAAAAAHVDPTDLAGALNTQGQQGLTTDPYVYLRANGALPSLPPPVAASPPAPASGVWARLAQCESTSNWGANTGNGFFGGIQFDRQTWLAYGGAAYAPRADLATPAQQIAVAQRLAAARGFQPWPACSRALGLR